MPVIHCPHCKSSVDIHPDDLGYKVLCPSCNSAFQAGEVPEPAYRPEFESAAAPPSAGTGERTVRCAGCRGQVVVGVEDLGHMVECPLCTERFRAEEGRFSDSAPDAESDRDSELRRSSKRRPRDDDDYDDDRGRRRRRVREEDRGYVLAKAQAAIAGPANGLMWTGIITTVLCLLVGGALLLGGLSMQGNAMNRQDRELSVTLIGYGIAIGVFGVPFHLFLAVAGYKMKQLTSTTWGYLAAITGISTIVLTGICSPSTWAAIAFGIWGIVALNKREVQDAIRMNSGRRY